MNIYFSFLIFEIIRIFHGFQIINDLHPLTRVFFNEFCQLVQWVLVPGPNLRFIGKNEQDDVKKVPLPHEKPCNPEWIFFLVAVVTVIAGRSSPVHLDQILKVPLDSVFDGIRFHAFVTCLIPETMLQGCGQTHHDSNLSVQPLQPVSVAVRVLGVIKMNRPEDAVPTKFW